MWRTDSLEKPWCWERLKAGEGDDRGWDGWMASLTWWSLSKLLKLVMDRVAWSATVHRVAKSWTWFSNWAWAQARFLFYIVPQKQWESVQFSRWVVSDSWRSNARQASLSITNSQSVLKLMSIQPSHLLLSPSPSTFNFSQHQGLFQWISSSQQVAKILEFQLQHQSFQWIFMTDFL